MGSYRNEEIYEVYRSGMHELWLITGEIKRLAVIWVGDVFHNMGGNTFIAESEQLLCRRDQILSASGMTLRV